MLNLKTLKNKKITILGIAKTGVCSANFLIKHCKNVFISDINKTNPTLNKYISKLNPTIKYETGKHSKKILDSDVIILSPGVSPNINILKQANNKKIKIYSEIEFAYNLIKPKYIIGITGTNGKTTTTHLVNHICKGYNLKTVFAGNIGTPLVSKINSINKNTILVLELSSYQLENIDKFRTNSAGILNISYDHIERHKNIKNYTLTKANIFKNQTKNDFTIYNGDDENLNKIKHLIIKTKNLCFSLKNKKADIFLSSGKIIYPKIKWQYDPSKLKIIGTHNIANVMAAVGLCRDIVKHNTKKLDKILSNFKGIEHRLEHVKTYKNITFINDSKATNIDSMIVALKSFPKKNNIILLMGGRHKGTSYKKAFSCTKNRVKLIVAFGESKNIIYKDLNKQIKTIKSTNLKESFKISLKSANKGDIILLSPACSSFDQFQNYEERGRYFKKLISSYKG